jgi:hypothetical protein
VELVLLGWLEIADADRAVGIDAEDGVEGIDHRRGRRDDETADDGHLALVNVTAPDGETAVDDARDAQDEAEHHDDGETVADARSQVGGTEGRALGKSGDGVECEQGGNGEERAKPRADFGREYFFHGVDFFVSFSGSAVHPPNHANTIISNADYEGVCDTQNAAGVLLNKTPMNTASNTNKLIKLHELDALLPREIRGQGQVLPRIISTVKRGELNLTKPGRPRGSFLLLGPTGVGKTETVVVLTNQVFGAGQLFRFDMSEFQTQESLGLLLGAKLGETGHLGAVRERAAEGSLLFDEAEKAHPRVLDILLQLLDAARITMATGKTLDFSGFYIWMTSNIGSAELMSLQHSNEATLERHVLSRAQQALRPEIFARINEKLVFNRLSYEHQLEIAEKFLSREIEFLATRGHKLELDKTVLPFLVRKGFHPKLGARPMRDAVEKLVGDAIAECLLAGRTACGALNVDEPHGCLVVR